MDARKHLRLALGLIGAATFCAAVQLGFSRPALAAGSYDGEWAGTYSCKQPDGDSYSFDPTVSVRGNEMTMVAFFTGRHIIAGRTNEVREKQEGTVDYSGNVALRGIAYSNRTRKSAFTTLRGKFDGDYFSGTGTRWNDECTLTLTRIFSPIEEERKWRAEQAHKAEQAAKRKMAAGTGGKDTSWRGNVRCNDRLRSRFEVTLENGRFSYNGYNLFIAGEIGAGSYDIRGRYRDEEFSVTGAFTGDAINASDEGLFSTCYVNIFRISAPSEQLALGATARESNAATSKQRADEIEAMKAEYQRLVAEDEAAKQKASTTVGVVTSPAALGVEGTIIPPEVKAAAVEIARLRQKIEELQIANQARDASGAVAARPGGPQAAALAGIDFGRYHAMVIGINTYEHLPNLKTAVNDAKAIARVLKDEYGFKVKLLVEARRGDIVEALDQYRETLGPKDNLLIYYAGHGWLDEEVDRGYWLPANARPKRRTNWVSNATITDTLKSLDAKHVMVVADSCYSGTLVRSANVGPRTRAGDYWKQMATKWARVAITSGGLEPVVDKGGGGHSPFARAFVQALEANKAIMDGTELFQALRRPVMVAADQTPEYSDVRNAGHDGGDFLFVRRK